MSQPPTNDVHFSSSIGRGITGEAANFIASGQWTLVHRIMPMDTGISGRRDASSVTTIEWFMELM